MIITWKSLLNENTWLNACIMDSLTNECIESGCEKKQYEVKLLVNGIEIEPKLLEKLILNVVKYIDSEALKVADEKLKDALHDVELLNDIIKEVTYKIRDKYEIPDLEHEDD
jgi:hypothetical protein